MIILGGGKIEKMIFDGAIEGKNFYFAWFCRNCGAKLQWHCAAHPGHSEGVLRKHLKITCPECGVEQEYSCAKAEIAEQR